MPVNIPSWAQDALTVLGFSWPGISEDDLRGWATYIRQFSATLATNSAHMKELQGVLLGGSHSAFLEEVVQQLNYHNQLIGVLQEGADGFAQALDDAAEVVVAQKVIIINQAETLVTLVGFEVIFAIATGGAGVLLDAGIDVLAYGSIKTLIQGALNEIESQVIQEVAQYAANRFTDQINRVIVGHDSIDVKVTQAGSYLKAEYDAIKEFADALNGEAEETKDGGQRTSAAVSNLSLRDATGPSGTWQTLLHMLWTALEDIAEELFRSLPHVIWVALKTLAGVLANFVLDLETADEQQASENAGLMGAAGAAAVTVAGAAKRGVLPGAAAKEGGALPWASARPGASRSSGECTAQGDPVDVATGDVIADATDVLLPGALPLALGRTHRSSRRTGRWFGESWLSSLDQRLVLAGGRVTGVFDDGRLLTWDSPVSGGGSPVLPDTGPRWSLHHRDDGGYTVSDPRTGRTWRFEQRAGHDEKELPLVSVTDRNGHEIAFGYDEAGKPATVTHSGGYRVLVSVTDARVTGLALEGRDGTEDLPLTRFGYDSDGNLADVTHSSGLPLSYAYDAEGRLAGWTDRNGYGYRYTFDDAGRCVRGDGPDGALSGTFSYEPGRTRWTDSAGAVTTYDLTASGQVAAVTDPLGHVTRYEYDDHDQVAVRVDPLGRTTRYGYDTAGNLRTITRPDGSQSAADYDDRGLPVLITDPDGREWRLGYDDRGNWTTLAAPDDTVTRFGYDSLGHLDSVTGPDGLVTTVDCDGAGLPAAVTAPGGARTRYETDRAGRVVRITEPDGGATTLAWTPEGRLVSRTFPDGTTESAALDGEGNITAHVSAAAAGTAYEHGPFGTVTAVTGPDGTRSEFSYDHALRVTQVRRSGLTWRYDYDAAGRLVAETDYNGAVTRYEYDAAGQLTRQVNAEGQEIVLGHDELGNVISQTELSQAGGEAVTAFGYDFAGRLAWARGPGADLRIERDALGRVISETCGGQAVTTDYGAAGQVTRRVTPSGQTARWQAGASGLPESVIFGGQRIRFRYDEAGREIIRELPGGLTLAQEWDPRGRMAAQILSQGSGQQHRRDYSFDPDGQVTCARDTRTGSRTFTLSPAGQVTRVTGTGWEESYSYDPAGNITAAAWPAAGEPWLDTGAQGRREVAGTLIARAGNIRYRYDRAGRVISRTKGRVSRRPETWRYAWDAADRLTTVTLPDGTSWHYRYDPLGRRIAKQHRSAGGGLLGETRFTWDGLLLAEQSETVPGDGDGDGDDRIGESQRITVWEYLPGTHTPVAQAEVTVRRGASGDESGRRCYAIITDITGTPAELASGGSVAGYQRHTLWGGTVRPGGGASTPLRFPGQYDDPETGLHYNNQRYYDPVTACYLTPDPLGLAPAPNPHRYTANPVVLIDPLGLQNVPYPGHVAGSPTPSLIPAFATEGTTGLGALSARHVPVLKAPPAKGTYLPAVSEAVPGHHVAHEWHTARELHSAPMLNSYARQHDFGGRPAAGPGSSSACGPGGSAPCGWASP